MRDLDLKVLNEVEAENKKREAKKKREEGADFAKDYFKESDVIERPSATDTFHKVQATARSRVDKELKKDMEKEDKKAFTESKKEATEIINESDVYREINEAKTTGGINLESAQTILGKAVVADLVKKYPGVFKKGGANHIEHMADARGKTVNELVTELQEAPNKKDAILNLTEELFQERQLSSELTFEAERFERVIDKEIEIVNDALTKTPRKAAERTADGEIKLLNPKKTIREQTGQIKEKTIEEIDSRIGLREQLKRYRKIGRDAYREGKLEEAQAANIRMKGILEQMKVRKKLSDMRKELQAIHKKVSKGQQYSQGTQDILERMFTGLDEKKMGEAKKIETQKTVDFLSRHPENTMPPDVLKDIERLGKKPITKLTFEETQLLFDAVKHQIKHESLKNTLIDRRKKRNETKTRKESIAQMRGKKEVSSAIASKRESQERTIFQTVKQGIKDFLGVKQLGYDTIIEVVSGKNSVINDIFFKQIKYGIEGKTGGGTRGRLEDRHTWTDIFQSGIEKLKLKPPGKFKTWEKWRESRFKAKGFDHDLSIDQAMSMYAHSLNPDNRAAMLEGGFGFRSNRGKKFKLTEDQLEAMIKALPKEAKAIVDAGPTKALFDAQVEKMKAVFFEENGYNMPLTEGFYFPKDVMEFFRKGEVSSEQNFGFTSDMTRPNTPKGRTIKRVGSTDPIYIDSFSSVISGSIRGNSTYVNLDAATVNASKLLYHPEFRKAMENKLGPSVWKEIETGLRTIVGRNTPLSNVEKSLLFLKNNITKAIIGANPYIVGLQPASYPMYNVFVEAKYMAQGAAKFASSPIKSREELMSLSPEARERFMSGYSLEIQDASVGKAGFLGANKTWSEKLVTPTQWTDQMAVTPGSWGAIFKVQAEIKQGKLSPEVKNALGLTDTIVQKMSKEQQMQEAVKFAEYVTAKTQPMFSAEHRSSLQSGHVGGQLVTMFGSFTNRAKDLMVSSAVDVRVMQALHKDAISSTKNPAEAKARFAKSVFMVMVLSTGAAIGRDELRNMIRNKESKLNFAQKIIKGWSGYVFGLRDVSNAIFHQIDSGYGTDVKLSPVTAPLDWTKEWYIAFNSAIKGEEGASLDLADSTAKLILQGGKGLPYSNVKNIFKKPKIDD